MKKLFMFCCLFVASIQTQAQTKEETISWLKEKLEKYLVPNGCGVSFSGIRGVSFCAFMEDDKYDIQIDACNITLIMDKKRYGTYASSRNLLNNWHTYIKITLPTNNFKSFGYGGPEYSANVIRINGYIENEFDDEDGNRQTKIREQWDNYMIFGVSDFIKIENGEENIVERIEKAIKHLSTFCPVKKETF